MADADDLAEIITGTPGSRSRAKTRIRWGINLAWFMGGIGVAGFVAGAWWTDFRRDMSTVRTQLDAISVTLNATLPPVAVKVAEHDIRIGNLEKTISQCCPAGRTLGSLPCLMPPGAIARR
jgi:hypothetical protein